jgi:hypothetical protein
MKIKQDLKIVFMSVSDPEMSNFPQVQGNQKIARRHTSGRTRDSARPVTSLA